MDFGVSNHLLSKVFRFKYHSQKVIGSLGQGAYNPKPPKKNQEKHPADSSRIHQPRWFITEGKLIICPKKTLPHPLRVGYIYLHLVDFLWKKIRFN